MGRRQARRRGHLLFFASGSLACLYRPSVVLCEGIYGSGSAIITATTREIIPATNRLDLS